MCNLTLSDQFEMGGRNLAERGIFQSTTPFEQGTRGMTRLDVSREKSGLSLLFSIKTILLPFIQKTRDLAERDGFSKEKVNARAQSLHFVS